MFRQKLYRIFYSMLYPRISENEIQIITERIYFEHLKHKQIPVIENKKIKWIDIDSIYFIKRDQKDIIIKSIYGEFVLRKSTHTFDLSETMIEFESFIKCTDNLFVNLLQIIKYDSYMQLLTFPNKIEIRVTQKIIRIIKGKLGKEKDSSKYL